MFPRAPGTREMDFLTKFFKRARAAASSGDYAPVEGMIAGDAALVTRDGRATGSQDVIGHLKAMAREQYRAEIVAPKGGLCTILIRSVSWDGRVSSKAYEQVFRLREDRIIEVIDLRRTQDEVYRPESQPN